MLETRFTGAIFYACVGMLTKIGLTWHLILTNRALLHISMIRQQIVKVRCAIDHFTFVFVHICGSQSIVHLKPCNASWQVEKRGKWIATTISPKTRNVCFFSLS